MTRYIAKDGERLDSIVYRHYGSLEHFRKVLEANFKLNAVLKAGDMVVLPEFKQGVPKQNKLW